MERIGDKIYHLRRRLGKTQEDIGGYLGISKQRVSNFENGSDMPDDKLEKIAEFFGLSKEQFLENDLEFLLTIITKPTKNETTSFQLDKSRNKKNYIVDGNENVVGESQEVYKAQQQCDERIRLKDEEIRIKDEEIKMLKEQINTLKVQQDKIIVWYDHLLQQAKYQSNEK